MRRSRQLGRGRSSVKPENSKNNTTTDEATVAKTPEASASKSGNAVITIDAEKIVDMELDRECILERSNLVTTAPARMPFIGFFGKYNKRWYVDIVALPHNSIRTFLSEVFTLLAGVHRLSLDMTRGDFEKLFIFVREFEEYSRAILDAEEKIVYPEIDSALKKHVGDYSNHLLNPENRMARKRKICELLTAMSPRVLACESNMAIVRTMQGTVDELSREMMEYFAVEERELPRLFAKAIRGPKEKTRVEGRLIEHFASVGHEYHYAALLVMHIQTEEVRADFEGRHFAKASARKRFRKAARNVRVELRGIPRAFERAAQRYEMRFSVGTFLQHYGKDRDADAKTKLV